jgi:hypothetical protein
MSEMPNNAQFNSPAFQCEHHDIRLLRSEYLDLFANLETELFRLGKRVQCSLSETAPLHQRLESLGKAKPSSHLSTPNAAILKKMVTDIDDHLRIRNCIVHSVMTVGHNGTCDAIMFQNATDRSLGHPFYLVLTVADFQEFLSLLRKFIILCAQISKPQPKQDQQGGL